MSAPSPRPTSTHSVAADGRSSRSTRASPQQPAKAVACGAAPRANGAATCAPLESSSSLGVGERRAAICATRSTSCTECSPAMMPSWALRESTHVSQPVLSQRPWPGRLAAPMSSHGFGAGERAAPRPGSATHPVAYKAMRSSRLSVEPREVSPTVDQLLYGHRHPSVSGGLQQRVRDRAAVPEGRHATRSVAARQRRQARRQRARHAAQRCAHVRVKHAQLRVRRCLSLSKPARQHQ
eukprot:scaffold80720_cov71-Phaeocystis_antarctica.AAC.15